MAENRRPTIGNMPHADLPVTFASGETRIVNMIILLAETLMSEQMARWGECQAGENMRSIEELDEKYELEYFFDGPVENWEDCAAVMRHFYNLCNQHMKDQGVI